jgi:hypothetical protein
MKTPWSLEAKATADLLYCIYLFNDDASNSEYALSDGEISEL